MHRFVTWCHAPSVGRERGACPSRRLRPFFLHKRGFGCRGYGGTIRGCQSAAIHSCPGGSDDGRGMVARSSPSRFSSLLTGEWVIAAHIGEAAACRALLADDHLVHTRAPGTLGRPAACPLVRRGSCRSTRSGSHTSPGGRRRRRSNPKRPTTDSGRLLASIDVVSTSSRNRPGVLDGARPLGGRPGLDGRPGPRFRPLRRPCPC